MKKFSIAILTTVFTFVIGFSSTLAASNNITYYLDVDKPTLVSEYNKTCKQVNGKYYGKNGKKISKERYIKECGQKINVPNNSANNIIWFVVLGVLVVTIATAILINKNNQKNNKKA